MKKILSILAVVMVLYAIGQTYKIFPSLNLLETQKKNSDKKNAVIEEKLTVVTEESTITKVVEQSLPSVVTIGINKTTASRDSIIIDPSNPLSPFKRIPGSNRTIEQNIGSGFIVKSDGIIITNRHVVEDSEAKYTVLTNDKKKYTIQKIYRDPLNDLAILKIDATNLTPLRLGDSSKLKLGQIAIAIGTPLGEFTNTVTVGIVSGLGRGITAGSPFEGYVEKLDNVIQTDAAINPGNSGGPLLSSQGLVIGVNTAVSGEGQNIGFAIPVNVVNNLMDSFNKRGSTFEKPYLGVRYKIIDKQTAILNDIVEGAYVLEILPESPAELAGIQEEDIITEFDGQKVNGNDDQALAKQILDKRIGESVDLSIWRDSKILNLKVILKASQ